MFPGWLGAPCLEPGVSHCTQIMQSWQLSLMCSFLHESPVSCSSPFSLNTSSTSSPPAPVTPKVIRRIFNFSERSKFATNYGPDTRLMSHLWVGNKWIHFRKTGIAIKERNKTFVLLVFNLMQWNCGKEVAIKRRSNCVHIKSRVSVSK